MTLRMFVLLRPVSFVLARAMRPQRFLPAGLVLAVLAFPLLAPTPAAAAQETKEPKGIDLIWGLKISMRDGVQLNATVYKPQEMREPLPVVFTLTPYVSDAHHSSAYRYAQQGYVSVLVDVRGRGNSGGEFEPHAGIEGRDGFFRSNLNRTRQERGDRGDQRSVSADVPAVQGGRQVLPGPGLACRQGIMERC